MNIFKRIARLFKRKPALVIPAEFNLRVRVVGDTGYTFNKYLQGKVYPAKVQGTGFKIHAPSVAASLPVKKEMRASVHNGPSDGSWTILGSHAEVVS